MAGAKEQFASYITQLYRDGDKEPNLWIRGTMGKHHGYTARFALILSTLNNHKVCTELDMEGAIKLSKYFITHARKVFKSFEPSKEEKPSIMLLNGLKEKA